MNKITSTPPFITDNFLLNSKQAEILYHEYAKENPIIDYHNHLPPKDITTNRQFNNCTEIWLSGDHYKWRAMRTFGVHEKYITGSASDEKKFQKWAETVEYTVRNPLYHWTHLELLRYFGITELLTSSNYKTIYENVKQQLQQESHRVIGLLKQQNVEIICTTEDPLDDLKYHKMFKKQNTSLKMSTSFRPDKAYAVENTKLFLKYLEDMEDTTTSINTFSDYLRALEIRTDYFHDNGCRLSDHGLSYIPYFETGEYDINKIFNRLKKYKQLSKNEIDYFKCETLKHLCKIYHKKNWVQQFHLGALRNVNSRLVSKIGVDSGFDSIGDFPQALNLGKFLDYLEQTNQLTKTIIYNLNSADNELIASMIGNFNDGSIKGKIQFGSGWWFLDQKEGIEKQLNALSNMGLISCFVGMLTDSRSFLSFPRHEYFRRILCNLFGSEIKNGQLPNDIPFLGKIINDICYNNAKQYFNL